MPNPKDMQYLAPRDAQERVWLLKYDDQAISDEMFVGAGAEQAARLRWLSQSAAWNCTLFETCERNRNA